MSDKTGKSLSREIVVVPCLCDHRHNQHRSESPGGRFAAAWGGSKVYILECLVKGCGCREFRVESPHARKRKAA